MRKRHYWRLDSKSITMFKSETGPNYYKEVPLSEILAVDSAKSLSGEPSSHCFEIRTANVDFFVVEDTNVAQSDEPSTGAVEGCWETAIKLAFKPVQSGSSSDAVSVTAAKEEKEKEKEKEGKETDISQAYQIFPDEVLGSGQFGIVYGGVHR
jgi:protein kinase D